jgi:hypothetical protein
MYIHGLPAGSEIKKAFDENRLAIVIADAVIESMDISVKIDTTRNAGLDAQLEGKLNQTFGSGNKMQVKLTGSGTGAYALKVTQPVVIARLTVLQPPGERRTGLKALPHLVPQLEPWGDWSPVLNGQS